MSATILCFPTSRVSPRAVRLIDPAAAPFSHAWCLQHLPLVDAALDLLNADDAEFERRFRLMEDADGRTMLGDLVGQIERLGTHIADVADALGLTAARIRDAMTELRIAPA